MRENGDLKKFIDPAVEEILGSSTAIKKEEVDNKKDRYELELTKEGEEDRTMLILNLKGNGRPVPTVTVNAVSELGENLFYRSQPINRSRKVILNVKEALREMVGSLKSS